MKMTMMIALMLFLAQSALAQSPSPAQLERGKTVFKTNCVTCHGEKGDGNGIAAAAIKTNKPRNFIEAKFKYGSDPKSLLKTVTNGVEGTAMPSWAHLPLEDREAVTEYVRSLKK